MSIKLIAIDLDGTLLDENRQITPAVRAAVQTATECGITVVLASGRMHRAILPIYEQLGLKTPVMCCNGAYVIMPDGTTLYRRPVGREAAREVVAFARENGLYVQYFVGDNYLREREGEESALYERLSGVMGTTVADMCAHPLEPDKLLFVGLPDLLPWMGRITERFPGLTVTTSMPFYIEINDPAANKGLAVTQLAANLGFATDEVMCIGDNTNDLPMLAVAGLPVAMGNAPEAVKAACRQVTLPNTQSGVAHAIYSWALPGSEWA